MVLGRGGGGLSRELLLRVVHVSDAATATKCGIFSYNDAKWVWLFLTDSQHPSHLQYLISSDYHAVRAEIRER